MAIQSSSGCSSSLAYFPAARNSGKSISTLRSNLKTFPFLSLPWGNLSSLPTVNYSASPPLSLEEAAASPPMVEFIYKVRNSEDLRQTQVGNFNKFIRELLRNPNTGEAAVEFYEKAKEKVGFRPQKSTLISLLKFLVRSKKWDSIPSLAQDLKKYQVFPDEITCARLISICVKRRKFRVAEMLLEAFEINGGNAGSAFDAAMRGYNKLHMYSSTIAVYERVKSAGILLDPGGYLPIMEAHAKLGNSNNVVELFDEMQAKENTDSNRFSTQIYEILFSALGKSGQAFKAVEYFKEMAMKGISPTASMYSSLISSFAQSKHVEAAEELMEEAKEKKMLKDPALFLELVLMYVENGMVEKSLDVVKTMKAANLKVSDCIFCAIVNGYAKQRGFHEAAKVHEKLISQGIEPGQVTYASILNVYCSLELYSNAENMFREMIERGFNKCVVAYSTMIMMYGKRGKLKEAMKLMAKMKERGCEPNVWIYNALIDFHGRRKNLRQVEKLWKEMKRRKVGADRITYTSVIGAYNKAQELEKCIHFYQEFRLNGGLIDRAMAGIMVGVFSKMSRIDKLVKLLHDIKAEGTGWDERLYRSASNALRDAGLEMQPNWMKGTDSVQ
ncbi:hypothetical protein Nepgr_020194 [Nepenthes gracilis]|uniref:PROP1-like PPR domain-containing protein n=1 Tax=Nepenthes gracilis TaxID=150966 RepID=A0AAD3SVH9_NEPGR|nr:hypothetical protein Nepgr_020194 [Nepenthes gracilis]